ncbi:hypothetical protein AB833_27845 [Chromatiales bacterium (ex Bugula neritina AB1)]|nr:hypothetical protein AB833_27845 [Chromatiales bacterium (ex Bugula neritina AB1)]
MADDIGQWLGALGLEKYTSTFTEQEIDLSVLPDLTDTELQELGLPLGPRKKILKAAGQLAGTATPKTPAQAPAQDNTAPDVAERRQLTVMFADLAGSSEMSTRLDPEDLREVMMAFQDASKSAIEKFGGYVARYMGDGVLAYFGYPQAHENDPQRSALAGLELLSSATALNEKLVQRGSTALRVRVGIATGPVVVGDMIGEASSAERAVVGETPNIAARIESAAPLDTVVVGESTHRLLGDRFECKELEPQMMKGFAQPMRLYQVLSEKRLKKRLQNSSDQAGFVGRQAEMQVLLNAWSDTRRSINTSTIVVGEPGVGKSRILAEFQRRIATDNPHVIEYRCSPFHSNTAFHPLVDHWLFDTGIHEDDSADTIVEKLQLCLLPAAQPADTATQLLASLLGVEIPGELPEGIADFPQRRLEAIQDLHIEQWGSRAKKNPLLIIFEDAHWMDPSTIDLIDRFSQLKTGHQVMTLVSSRPSDQVRQAFHRIKRAIKLSGLSKTETVELISNLPQSSTLAPDELAAVIERTDGIPLFVEELTKLVLERSGEHSQSNTIPNTLIDSLTERLDRLGSAKEIAQVGATIGRQFSHHLLSSIVNRSSKALDKDIDRLVASELVEADGSGQERNYRFRHALIQDAAYDTLLYAVRKQHHSRIADVLLGDEIPHAKEQPEVIAHHLAEADRPMEAIDYWHVAGNAASSRSENVEAVNHLMAGIETLQKMPQADEAVLKREFDLQVSLGPPLVAARGYASIELEAAFNRALDIGRQLDRGITNYKVLHGLGSFYLIAGNLNQALELQRQCLKLAVQTEDYDQQLLSTSWLGTIQFYRSEMNEAVEMLNHTLDIYGLTGPENSHAYGLNPAVLARTHLVWYYWLIGDIDKAYSIDEQTLQFALELKHPLSYAHAMNFSVVLQTFLGDFETSKNRADALFEHATERQLPHYVAYSTIMGGYARARLGNFEKGINRILAGMKARSDTGAALAKPMFLTMYADLLAEKGDYSESLKQIDMAKVVADKTTEQWYSLETARTHAVVSGMHSANTDEAAAALNQTAEKAKRCGFRSVELRSLNSLIRALQASPAITTKQSAELARLQQLLANMPATISNSDQQQALELIG